MSAMLDQQRRIRSSEQILASAVVALIVLSLIALAGPSTPGPGGGLRAASYSYDPALNKAPGALASPSAAIILASSAAATSAASVARNVSPSASVVAAEASSLPELTIYDAQFGQKVGQHAQDFGLDPADPEARALAVTASLGSILAIGGGAIGAMSVSTSAWEPATHAYDSSPDNVPPLQRGVSMNAGAAAGVNSVPRGRSASSPVAGAVAAEEASHSGTALEPMWAQAPNSGFLGGWSTPETLQPGSIIDRYGAETGRFFSPAGTPLEARSLQTGAGPLNTYEVLKPFEVRGGIAAPAFGQPGLGAQCMAPQTVADLIEGGFIKPVTP